MVKISETLTSFKCPECYQIFFGMASVSRHYRCNHKMLSNIDRWICTAPHCNHIFQSENRMKGHVKRMHNKRKKHKIRCNICGAGFATDIGLNNHFCSAHLNTAFIKKIYNVIEKKSVEYDRFDIEDEEHIILDENLENFDESDEESLILDDYEMADLEFDDDDEFDDLDNAIMEVEKRFVYLSDNILYDDPRFMIPIIPPPPEELFQGSLALSKD